MGNTRVLVVATTLAALVISLIVSPLRAQSPSASQDKYAPDIKPEAIWDGRKIMPFKTLDYPDMVPAYGADFLDDTDYVLGVVVNGEARAYPTRFIWWHHLINDKGGKSDEGGVVPFVVSYCSVCNTGIRYNPVVDGKTLMFDFYGLYNGVVTVCERETQTVFLQAEGRGVKGPLTGVQLKPEPLLDTTWSQWKRLHPETLVMAPKPPYEKYYSKRGKPEPRGYEKFPAPFFQPTITRGDLRLEPFVTHIIHEPTRIPFCGP